MSLFETPAIRLSQPIGDFWLCAIPARVLLDVTYPDPLRVAAENPDSPKLKEWRDAGLLEGNQRPLDEPRLKEIAQYIDSLEATFPNTVILAANSTPEDEGLDESRRWKVVDGNDGHARLIIPERPFLASVVDGQHRLYAFNKTQLPERRDFALACAVFFEMPYSIQAMLFATININQKAVRRGLAMNLYGYNVQDEERQFWSPEKLSVFMARRLNFDSKSPLHYLIKIEADNAPLPARLPGAARPIPMAAIVDGIMGLITRNPQRDRNALRSERLITRARRKSLPADRSPLRNWYTGGLDLALYSLVGGYLDVVKKIVWSKATDGSMLTRAVGIRALFNVLGFLLTDKHPEVAAATTDEVAGVVEPLFADAAAILATATDRVVFTDRFFEASDRGRRRIANTILFSAGLIEISALPSDEHADYFRLVGK